MSAAPVGPSPLALRLVTLAFKASAIGLATITVIIVITSVWWRLTPERELDLLVYDQTVPDKDRSELAMLQQLLEYHHIDYDRSNYIGAEVGGARAPGTWPNDQPDLIILADVYGVYLDASGRVSEEGGTRVTDAVSIEQARDIERWVNSGTPAYAEFALVTEPTPPDVAAVFEDTFGFRALPWTGQVVEELADVSTRIKALGPSPWPYSGPGIIFRTVPVPGWAPEPQIVVLDRTLLDKRLPRVVGGPPTSIPGESTFDRWFGVVEPAEGTVVDAWFEIRVNEAGAEVLAEAGIPSRFPALVRTERTLYFAGDGLDDATPFRLRHLQGGALFTRLVTGREYRFTYQILEPSLAWLLDQSGS